MCVLVAQSCLTLRAHGLWPTRLRCPWNSPGKKLTVVGTHSLLQGGSSRPRDQTWVSCIAGSFFIIWATKQLAPSGKFKFCFLELSGVLPHPNSRLAESYVGWICRCGTWKFRGPAVLFWISQVLSTAWLTLSHSPLSRWSATCKRVPSLHTSFLALGAV